MLLVKRYSALMVFGAYALSQITRNDKAKLAWIEGIVESIYNERKNYYIIKWFLCPRPEFNGRCALDVLANDPWELGDDITRLIEAKSHYSNER